MTRHVVENVDGYDMILNIQHCMVVGVQTLLGGFPNHHFKKMSRFQSCFICKIITCQKYGHIPYEEPQTAHPSFDEKSNRTSRLIRKNV